jgi:hypothetical protein
MKESTLQESMHKATGNDLHQKQENEQSKALQGSMSDSEADTYEY